MDILARNPSTHRQQHMHAHPHLQSVPARLSWQWVAGFEARAAPQPMRQTTAHACTLTPERTCPAELAGGWQGLGLVLRPSSCARQQHMHAHSYQSIPAPLSWQRVAGFGARAAPQLMRQNEEARRIQAEELDYEQILAQGLRPYAVTDDAQEVGTVRHSPAVLAWGDEDLKSVAWGISLHREPRLFHVTHAAQVTFRLFHVTHAAQVIFHHSQQATSIPAQAHSAGTGREAAWLCRCEGTMGKGENR